MVRSLSHRLALAALTLLAAFGLALGGPAAAWAHSGLVRADPTPGGHLTPGATRIELTFGPLKQDVAPAVHVFDAGGAELVTRATLVAGQTVEVEVRPLALGTHRLTYQVSSVDSHLVKGGYSFEVLSAQAAADSAGMSQLGAGAALLATLIVAAAVVVLRGRIRAARLPNRQKVDAR